MRMSETGLPMTRSGRSSSPASVMSIPAARNSRRTFAAVCVGVGGGDRVELPAHVVRVLEALGRAVGRVVRELAVVSRDALERRHHRIERGVALDELVRDLIDGSCHDGEGTGLEALSCASSRHDGWMSTLDGAHVLVTGGSSGIGLETARGALRRGARVSLIARDAGRLASAEDDLETGAGDATRVAAEPADVTDPAALERALALLTAQFGPVDVAVANAGAPSPATSRSSRSRCSTRRWSSTTSVR